MGNTLREVITAALTLYGLPSSPQAIELLIMIAAHESGGFTYCKQVRGPALGIYQMEPATFYDVKDYLKRTERYPALLRYHNPERLIFDINYATAMARAFFLRIPEPIPNIEDKEGLARYAKKYWNTELGKATPQQYLTAYQQHGGTHAHC